MHTSLYAMLVKMFKLKNRSYAMVYLISILTSFTTIPYFCLNNKGNPVDEDDGYEDYEVGVV